MTHVFGKATMLLSYVTQQPIQLVVDTFHLSDYKFTPARRVGVKTHPAGGC